MTNKPNASDLLAFFDEIEDPRIERQKLHALSDILFIVFCGVICEAESWEDFKIFAQSKRDFLSKFIELKNGIPSKNTFHRVITRLNPDAFRDCFMKWVQSFEQELGNLIAIDGKTVRKSADVAFRNTPIHMVSAFAAETRLVLAQQKVDEKSNEITALPKLLELIDLQDSVVTIDAMGCQKAIAKNIIAGQGDYVLAVKGNQKKLHHAIQKHFSSLFEMRHHKHVTVSTSEEVNRGRKDTRTCFTTSQLDWLDVRDEWPEIASVSVVESKREENGKESIEHRYYISSLEADAEDLNHIIRSHWRIENNLHWVLDVVFREDASRVRKDHGPENLAMIRHVVMNKLKTVQERARQKVHLKHFAKRRAGTMRLLRKYC